jgi:hypothetical protein
VLRVVSDTEATGIKPAFLWSKRPEPHGVATQDSMTDLTDREDPEGLGPTRFLPRSRPEPYGRARSQVLHTLPYGFQVELDAHRIADHRSACGSPPVDPEPLAAQLGLRLEGCPIRTEAVDAVVFVPHVEYRLSRNVPIGQVPEHPHAVAAALLHAGAPKRDLGEARRLKEVLPLQEVFVTFWTAPQVVCGHRPKETTSHPS